ncbi:hypothetical protein BKA64DRAFT_707825 [Cadophora sp. MPI-SDFR-AT-0126]|nr:hypothetical protein BKA64DRAFT_707825 [Leotiomycetes sp. MPI-SDFR-AT-0126]
MTSKKSRFGSFFRFLSPGPSSRPPSPGIRYQGLDGYESQSRPPRGYDEQGAMVRQPETTWNLIPARPPAHFPIASQQVRYEHGLHQTPEPYHPQQHYAPRQTYRPLPANPVYSPSVPTTTCHVCRLCVATDRFPIRPTRCPLTGEYIGSMHSQQHPPVVTTSFMHQAQVTRRSHFERVDFEELQKEKRNDEMMECEFNGGDRTRDTSREDHVDYLNNRKKRITEEWMDRCIDERCPGWESVREPAVLGQTRWQDSRKAEGIDEGGEETKGDAWRMLDEVWRV